MRRLGTARYWLPFLLGFTCLVVATRAGALAGWLLLLAAFVLLFDGATALWARTGATGRLTDFKQ